MNELPCVRLGRDVGSADKQKRSKLSDLFVLEDGYFLDHHGASLADGNGGAEAPPFK